MLCISRKVPLVIMLLLIPLTASATFEDIVIKQSIRIAPDKSYLLEIKSSEKLELGMFVDKTTPCKQECIALKQTNTDFEFELKTPTNAFSNYEPANGSIKILYRNIASHPVSITVHKYLYHCTASACDLLTRMGALKPLDFVKTNGDYKRIRIATIATLKTSEDGSWSEVKGKTLSGKRFHITFIWWLYDGNRELSCGKGKYIARYKAKLDKGGGPVLIAGKLVEGKSPVFIKVDTCSSRAKDGPDSKQDF